MRVGYCQVRPHFGRVEQNVRAVVGLLATVEADLVVLPELAFTGYHFRDRRELLDLAEDPDDSPTVTALTALAQVRDFHLVTGFAERRRDKVFNSALLIGPRGVEAVYRKLHLFNDETLTFDPGDLPLRAVDVRGARIGMMVCFDWAFPEVARCLAIDGAEILCHPSNLVLQYCQQAMLTRCLENAVYAVTTNRFGADVRPHGQLHFTGRSQIVAPGGRLLVRAPAQRRAVAIVDLDPALARDKRIAVRNDLLRDRRPEFYARLGPGESVQGATP